MSVRQVGVKRIEAPFHAAAWFQTRLADQPFETVSFVTHLGKGKGSTASGRVRVSCKDEV